MSLFIFAGSILLSFSSGQPLVPQSLGEAVCDGTVIFADAEWYRTRPEEERVVSGVLKRHDATLGPGGRGGITHVLVTSDDTLFVYAAQVEADLAPYLCKQVVVCGKLVDLRNEGFGRELWIGSIQQSTQR